MDCCNGCQGICPALDGLSPTLDAVLLWLMSCWLAVQGAVVEWVAEVEAGNVGTIAHTLALFIGLMFVLFVFDLIGIIRKWQKRALQAEAVNRMLAHDGCRNRALIGELKTDNEQLDMILTKYEEDADELDGELDVEAFACPSNLLTVHEHKADKRLIKLSRDVLATHAGVVESMQKHQVEVIDKVMETARFMAETSRFVAEKVIYKQEGAEQDISPELEQVADIVRAARDN